MGLFPKQYTPHVGQVRILSTSPTSSVCPNANNTINNHTITANPSLVNVCNINGQPNILQHHQQQQQQQIYSSQYQINQQNQSQTQLSMSTLLSPNNSQLTSYYSQTAQNPSTQSSQRQGSILSQLRSWQRSRKLRSLNKQQKDQQQFHQQKSQQNQIVNPMNNLCYQSMNPLRQDMLDGSYKSSSSELISLEACSTTSGSSSRSSMTDTQNTSPIVSFRNQGDGQIAMHLPGSPGTGSRLIHLNESQLYALQAHFIKNAQEITENCYASLEGPQHSTLHVQTKDDPLLMREAWFYGSITREKAVETLQNCPTGSFVVRTSGTNIACFALTMRVPHDYNHTGVSHYLILCDNNKFKIKGFTKEFDTLTSLIVHHSIMKEQLPCTLRLHDNRSSNNTNNSPSGHHYHTVKSHYRSSPSLVYSNNNNNINNSSKYGQSIYGQNMMAKSMLRLNGSSNNNNNNNSDDIDNDDCGPVYNDVDSTNIDDDPLMVDIDQDPTYQKILDNFRKSMAACS